MGHAFGTEIRRNIDAKALGKAISAPGLDLRYWCSLAVVCTHDPETGEKDLTDKLAIYNDSAGVDVDVELQPLGQPCTCKYAGIQAGDVTICAPIRPGDIVLVECPDGDLYTPVITHIVHSRAKRQPTEDGKPIFDNNRLLIYAKNVPIDIRTAGGVRMLLDQDGNVNVTASTVTTTATTFTTKAETKLGDENASQHVMHGELFTTDLSAALTAILADLVLAFTMLGLTPPGPTSTDPVTQVLTGIASGTYLATKVTAT